MMDNKTLGMIVALGGSGSGGGGGASAITDLSDVSISSPSDGQALKYNSTTEKWENSDDVGATIDDSTTSATKVWSSNKTNTELGKKENAHTTLTETLTAGSTQVVFTDSSIVSGSWIDVATSDGTWYSNAVIDGTNHTCTLTFPVQSADITVSIKVS